MAKRILLAGPWVGEFGHELWCWQGYVRYLSKDYKNVIVISRPGHEVLYQDFATKFIGFDPGSDKLDRWYCNGGKPCKDLFRRIRYNTLLDGQKFNIGYKHDYKHGKSVLSHRFNQQKFVAYGKKIKEYNYDILIHARWVKRFATHDRNWSRENWNQLVSKLDGLKMGSIGHDKLSIHIEGTDDLRGICLSDLCDIMASSKLACGPSSGPMHLASLCKLPHLVWSPMHNKNRYKTYWNKLGTKCYFVGEYNWQPPVKTVVERVKFLV